VYEREQVLDVSEALLPADMARGETIGYLCVFESKPQILTAYPANCLTDWLDE
jgi:hypothetical protein